MLTEWWVCGRQLSAGKLLDLGVTDGSKLTLVPVIEAGLVVSISQRTLIWEGGGLVFTNLTICSVSLCSVRPPGLRGPCWKFWKI